MGAPADCVWKCADEGEVVGCEFVIVSGDTLTQLDLVEEAFDDIARTIQDSP
jgi:hypothetical protein